MIGECGDVVNPGKMYKDYLQDNYPKRRVAVMMYEVRSTVGKPKKIRKKKK